MNEKEKSINNFSTNNLILRSFKDSFNEPGFIVKIVIGIILLTLIATGLVLASRIWDPIWNPFRPSPDRVVAGMIEKMEGVKTYHFRGNAVIKVTGPQTSQMLIDVSGDSDFSNPDDLKTETNFNFQIKEEKTGNSFSIGGETRSIKNTSYFQLTSLDFSPELNFYLQSLGISKDKIIGQWVRIDKEIMKNLGTVDETKTSKEEQKKIEGKIRDIFKNKKILKVEKIFPDQKINGKEAYHYLLSLNKERIKEVVPQLLAIFRESSVGETIKDYGSEASAEEKIKKEIDDFFEKIGGVKGEIWIGKKDYYLYRLLAEKEIEAGVFDNQTEGKLAISLEFNAFRFNQLVSIKMPDNSLGLDKLLEKLVPFLQGRNVYSSSTIPDSLLPPNNP